MKIIEAVILKRIEKPITKILSKYQVGFVKKGECGMHLVQLAAKIRDLQKTPLGNGNYFCTFFDFKSAFNRVSHEILFTKLTKAGIENEAI